MGDLDSSSLQQDTKMRKLKESVIDLLASWGLPVHRTMRGAPRRELRVVLPYRGERIMVGILVEEGDEYVFRYTERFQRQKDIPPISAFPDVHEEYRATELWPFFAVRLPPVDRPDIEVLLKKRGVQKGDALAVLGALAQKPISTPFEFEMAAT